MAELAEVMQPAAQSGENNGNRDNGNRDAKTGQFRPNNVFRFERGRSGNPRGRPRREPITEAIAADLEAIIPQKPALIRRCQRLGLSAKTTTWATLIARSMIWKAMTSVEAAEHVASRVEGRPRQKLEVSGPDGRHFMLRVVYEDKEQSQDFDRTSDLQVAENTDRKSV